MKSEYTNQQYIESLHDFDKIKLYLDYYITQIGLKYNFEIVFNYREKNWRTPDLFINDIGIYFIWKDINPKTLDEFFEVEYRDCGEEWEQNGFAQKIWVLCPATDWYSRFKDRVKI